VSGSSIQQPHHRHHTNIALSPHVSEDEIGGKASRETVRIGLDVECPVFKSLSTGVLSPVVTRVQEEPSLWASSPLLLFLIRSRAKARLAAIFISCQLASPCTAPLPFVSSLRRYTCTRCTCNYPCILTSAVPSLCSRLLSLHML